MTKISTEVSKVNLTYTVIARLIETERVQRRIIGHRPHKSTELPPKPPPLPAKDLPPAFEEVASGPSSTTAVCGICQDPFTLSSDPLRASRSFHRPSTSTSSSSSDGLPFYSQFPTGSSQPSSSHGLALPCPRSHNYCLGCMTTYIRTQADPTNAPVGGSGEPFSVRCPECPRTEEWRFDDATAMRILEGSDLEGWWFRKLLSQLEWVSLTNEAGRSDFADLFGC